MDAGLRHEIRDVEVETIKAQLERRYGIRFDGESLDLLQVPSGLLDLIVADGASAAYHHPFLVDREPQSGSYDTKRIPTLHGSTQTSPTRRTVSIDSGAVDAITYGKSPAISSSENGFETDSGAPRLFRDGIDEVDPAITEGDYVLLKATETDAVVGVAKAEGDASDVTTGSGVAATMIHQSLNSGHLDDINELLLDDLGLRISGETFELLELHDVPYNLVLVDGYPEIFYYKLEPYPTIPAVNRYGPEKGIVVVDESEIDGITTMGFVEGSIVVDADETIEKGDRIVVKTHGSSEVVAIGKAKRGGKEMFQTDGKAVETITYVDGPLASTVAMFYDDESEIAP